MKYRIRNWEKFQHYRDRSPPWIKLHFELLSSSDWVMLDDASRVLAIACMLLASRSDARGEFDGSPEYVMRVAYLHASPDFAPLVRCGFLEPLQADASALQADASALQADASALQADASKCYSKRVSPCIPFPTETETETESEAETETEESEGTKTAPPVATPTKVLTKQRPTGFKAWTMDEFIASVEADHNDHLDPEETKRFINYWSEKSNSGRMRFSMQDTWETPKRLATWAIRAQKQASKDKVLGVYYLPPGTPTIKQKPIGA